MGRLIFFQRLKIYQGIQIIPSDLIPCQGVQGVGGVSVGGGLIFFSGGSSVFFRRIYTS